MIILTLGRDGMGSESTEADFDAWVDYVCEHIDEACGFEVGVQVRSPRDVQSDDVPRWDENHDVVTYVLTDLWEGFCADVSWPTPPVVSDETRDCLGLAVHGRTQDNEP